MARRNTDEVERAFGEWFRSGGIDQPSNSSSMAAHAGRKYVVLDNANGILAVYRVRNDGALRRLKRWPRELGD
jgi:hypothetical protein